MTDKALNAPPARGWMTVGELRAALETLDDDAPMFVDGNPDRAIAFAYPTQQIHPDDVATWTSGDRLVPGLEVWLEDIDDPEARALSIAWFDDWRCRHGSTRAPSTAADTEARQALARLYDQAHDHTAGDYPGRKRARTDRDAILRIIDARRRKATS